MPFPFRIQLGELLLDSHKFPVDRRGSTGLIVSLGFFEFGDHLDLPRLIERQFFHVAVGDLKLGP